MEVLYPACAGLDVHKNSVVACVRIHGANGRASRETRTFGTHTAALVELEEWLAAHQCTHVVMAQHVNRIQKVLEDANLKIGSLIADIVGLSGRAILDAIVQGETSAEKLVELTRGRLKAPRATLVLAAQGHITKHHRFLLRTHWNRSMRQIAALLSSTPRLRS